MLPNLRYCNFIDALSPVVPGNARFVLANSADAPALQANTDRGEMSRAPKTFTGSAEYRHANGDQAYRPALIWCRSQPIGSTTVLTSQQISLADQSVTYTYACGAGRSTTLWDWSTAAIRDVF